MLTITETVFQQRDTQTAFHSPLRVHETMIHCFPETPKCVPVRSLPGCMHLDSKDEQ